MRKLVAAGVVALIVCLAGGCGSSSASLTPHELCLKHAREHPEDVTDINAACP